MTSTRRHVVVVGAGIAGLTAAERLSRRDDLAVTLIERDDRLGGKIRTEEVDGLVIEGGPDAFLSWKPRGKAMCDELGLTTIGSNEEARRAFVMRDGRLHPLPDGIAGVIPRRFAPTLRSPLLSLGDKARLLVEWAVPRRPDEPEQSLAGFVRRRAGRGLWERIAEPLVTGVYAGDGERLSVRATFPMLLDAERDHGSLARAGIAARRAGRTPPPGPMFLTTAKGLGAIVEALAERLRARGATIRTGVTIDGLDAAEGAWTLTTGDGTSLRADAVVLATPAPDTARLLAPHDDELGREVAAVRTVSVATVSVAYAATDVHRPIDGHGYVNPRVEGSPIVAVSLTSTKFPARARPGIVLARAHVGRMGEPDPCWLDDATLIDCVHEELTRTLGVAAPPLLARVARWPEAIPQYDVGHKDRVARVRDRLTRLPGLAVAGATWRGVGIPDCISSGDEAAEAALAYLPPATT